MDNGASSYLRVLDGAAESFFEKAKAIETHTDLYSRYVDGNDEAFVDLIRQYKDGLIFYLDSFTHNIFEAEDLAQETFVKIAIHKPFFSPRAQFKTWLYTIARNLAIDWLRKQAKQNTLPLESAGDMPADEISMEQNYLRQEKRILVRRALRRIKCDYSQVLYLVYFEGFNNAQAAKIMKKSKRQIENLLYQAKKALKSELCKEALFNEES